MRRNYDTEIEELPITYRESRAGQDVQAVAAATIFGGPAVFVGSGGALAAARLAADLHIQATGRLGVAATPLDAASMQLGDDTALVLFTASGRHPDAALALNAARRRGAPHLGVITTRSRSELPPSLGAGDVHVGTVTAAPDGFLATNSLLAMCTALCAAYGTDLPPTLPALDGGAPPPSRPAMMVLNGPGLASVAVDLEARLVETGLASVQLADYRNAAHGRHVGLIRNVARTTVVGLTDPRSERIASRTLELLPEDVEVVRLHSDLAWPASALDLLVSSMRLVAETGRARGVDPGRPGVKPFGRRLYHLPTQRLVPSPAPDPVRRKAPYLQTADQANLRSTLSDWLDGLRSTGLGGVVLDYDGTCCSTWDRFRLPPEDVRGQIVRLLSGGVKVGFATGRGKSLHHDTRGWLPSEYWPDVVVGLYNGSRLLRLNQEPPASLACDGDLALVADRIEAMGKGTGILIERRTTQVSVSYPDGCLGGLDLLPAIQALIERSPRLPCKALASGHSVDIVSSTTSKVAVLDELRRICEGDVLAIGDQGQAGGNDFELLAATPWSLSVDRCSGDPTRCWNLDSSGQSGPDLLVRYLRAIRTSRSAAHFAWGH